MLSLKIPTSLRRAIFQSPELSQSLRSNRQEAPPAIDARGNVPRCLSQYAARPWKQRKSSIFGKNPEGVTILQWSKRFDATLGACACWWRFRYFEELLRRAAIAQSSDEDSSSHRFLGLCLLPSTASAGVTA